MQYGIPYQHYGSAVSYTLYADVTSKYNCPYLWGQSPRRASAKSLPRLAGHAHCGSGKAQFGHEDIFLAQ
jgi:hypothetical protein